MTTEVKPDQQERPSYIPVLPAHGDYDVEPGQEPVPWKKVGIWLVVVTVLVLVTVVYTIPGYVEGEKDELRERMATCQPVPDVIRAAIIARVAIPGGEVTNWAMHESASDEVWFVSADIREEGLAKGADGELATWATRDPAVAAGDYAVMEPKAREFSSWAARPSELEITDAGALGSRYCTVQLREDEWREEFPAFL